ncbi:putative membrane protein [Methylacidimicrobium cyclopophantes]|uniref:Membrane protein n=1 Tax=Methylacidimicrobium cyclopophantes TaxID=1041766 RepID=A0A5E6MPI7_9BACT|nr:VTT domain-containing protein [Methylacidimicrobium cyclopophantes]VVM07348.1 putative membrane protein [Methylacidimicrobium cyclopophantes]
MDWYATLAAWEDLLRSVVKEHGFWAYPLLFGIVFCETGLVVTPFLPGDSLLFLLGAFAGQGWLHLPTLLLGLILAAVLGDSMNYWIGLRAGPAIFHDPHARWLNRRQLIRARALCRRYGARAIVIARFIPVLRTFAPFVAGVGTMSYPRFFFWNAAGGISWVALFLLAGFFLGGAPAVQRHLHLLLLLIIVVSLLPVGREILAARMSGKARPTAGK